jgi:putative transposase
MARRRSDATSSRGILTILDVYTRECLDIAVGRGLTGHDVVAALEPTALRPRLAAAIYCDNGSEFVSAAMDLWAYTNKVILDFGRRGTPPDNATIESFNCRFRAECLNVHWFLYLEDAEDYNEHHPYGLSRASAE